MEQYTDVHGVQFTEDDIERWAAEDESPAGYTGGHLGPSVPGRPISLRGEHHTFAADTGDN